MSTIPSSVMASDPNGVMISEPVRSGDGAPPPPTTLERADGTAKVTGSARYSADLTLPGMAFAAFRYADVPHARIISVDTAAARAIEGVLAVICDDDVPDVRFGPGVADRRLFARDVVRFEGEVIAAVAARTLEAARRAAAAIIVDYEELPIVDDLEAALDEHAPLVHADWQTYAVDDGVIQAPNVAMFSSIVRGDADGALADCAHVLTERYVADASHAAPIEPRAVLAQWEGDKVTIWTSTQVPFDARAGVCETLSMPSNKVRVIVPHLGGGFGGKCGFHFEAHVAALARAAKRPVKLVFTRREEFLAPDRRREQMIIDLTSGLDAAGNLVARTGSILIDNGAYCADATFFPQMAIMHAGGPYRIPNASFEARLVYTNRQPSGSVRAPTAPEVCWAVESHTDALARLAGIDPVAFRRQNALRDGDETLAGQPLESIGLQACIDQAVQTLPAPVEAPPEGVVEATGIAISWWPSFPGPSGAWVKMDRDGAVQVITGAQECGTGAVMTLRYLAADELGVDPATIDLIYQDTGAAPFGSGATGSQTLINNGRAVVEAAQKIAEQLRELAAAELEANPADIELVDGTARVVGSPDTAIDVTVLAARAADDTMLVAAGSGSPPPYPSTSATCVGDQGVAGFAGPQFGCHAVRVRVDAETGVVRVVDVAAAHDSGTIINPTGARGQVHGGVMMGIGQALTERTVYDDSRQANPALTDYKLQTAADVASITVSFVEPDPVHGVGPKGAKGIAEAPNVPTPGAIANAVAAAIGHTLHELPLTAERVWTASKRTNAEMGANA